MKNLELSALKVLKITLDVDISANKQVSSKCLALLYQPKRIVVDEKSRNSK